VINEVLNIIVKTTHKGDGAKKAAKGLDDIKKAAGMLAGAFAAIQAGSVAVELVQLGASAQRQATALNNLASAADTSGDAIVGAMQEASQFTIDKMSAMAAANKAMVMDVAKSPEEFERLTRVAVSLGRAMGQDATKSIDDFVTASARQSQMIADNLGLTVTVGQATERYAAKLGITVDQLSDAERKQAFLNMMLEEGEKKMAELGNTTLDTAGKIEQSSTAWKDAKQAVGGALAAFASATGILDKVSGSARNAATGMESLAESGFNVRAWLKSMGAIFDKNQTQMEAYTAEIERQAQAEDEHLQVVVQKAAGMRYYSAHIEEAAQAQDMAAYSALKLAQAEQLAAAAVGTGERWNQYQAALDATAASENATAIATLENTKAQEAAALAAQSAATATAGLAASLKDATDAQIAQAAISQLGQALQDGQIDADTYATAVQETQVAFGLADAQSIALTGSLTILTEALASGQLKATDYNEALTTAIAQSYSAGVEANAFGAALAGIPDKKVVTLEYNIVTKGSAPSGAAGGGTLGGDAQALGTGFAMGGMTLVGERGPELVSLPRGSQVFSAGQTRGMMRSGGGGGGISIGPVYIQGESPEVIWRKLERYARLKNKSTGPQMGR